MPFTVMIVGQIACAAAGVALLYVALFLYENEERQLQSKVEDWWIALADSPYSAESRLSTLAFAFLSRASFSVAAIFGDRKWCMAAARAIFALVLPAFIGTLVLAFAFLLALPGASNSEFVVIVEGWVAGSFVYTMAGLWLLMKARNGARKGYGILNSAFVGALAVPLFAALAAVVAIVIGQIRGRPLDLMMTARMTENINLQVFLAWWSYLAPCGVAIVVTAAILWLSRLSLEQATSRKRIGAALGLGTLSFGVPALAISAVATATFFSLMFSNQIDFSAGTLLGSLIDALVQFLVIVPICAIAAVMGASVLVTYVGLALALIFGRVFVRGLYAIARHELVRNKKWLVATGIALIGVPPLTRPFVRILEQLLRST
ncbi:MAG: hypothetical protein RLZZ26_88 [Candidatus Parcubacteria bacterium]|jgi:hypothetical protein